MYRAVIKTFLPSSKMKDFEMKKTLLLVLLIGISGPYLQASTSDEKTINTSNESAINVENCSICLDPLSEEGPTRVDKPCRHQFHEDCINRWLENHTTCPICRAILREPAPRIPSALRRINELRNFNPRTENPRRIGFVLNRRNQLLNNRLLQATRENNIETVQNLLTQGARPDTPTSDGNTPLHIATQNSNPNVVSLLLSYGANPSIPNADGKTPLDLAREIGEDDIAGILEVEAN